MFKLYILALGFLFFTAAKAQCHARDEAAAEAVGRPCRKSCERGSYVCKEDKTCLCDHECGLSCINLGNTCEGVPNITNMNTYRVYRAAENGSKYLVDPPYKYDDVAEYECEPGYEVSRTTQVACHGRRQWTGSATCILSCEERTNINCNTACATDDDCSAGMNCLCDGGCGATCVNVDVDCGPAPDIVRASLRYTGEGFLKKAIYSCDEDFYLEAGSTTKICRGNGIWEGENPICEHVTCSDPTSSFEALGGVVLGNEEGTYFVGNQLSFSCPNPVHRLLGSKTRTCLKTGRWSGLTSVCDEIDNSTRCPHPGIPINGNISSPLNFSIGGVVEFECNEGYVMFGQQQQECLYFLEWSGNGAPDCIRPQLQGNKFEVAVRIEESAATLKDDVVYGRAGRASFSSGHEVFFVFDISEKTSEEVLQNSIRFASLWTDKVGQNNSIRCGIIAFASEGKYLAQMEERTPEMIKRLMEDMFKDRTNLARELGTGRNTYLGLIELQDALEKTFQENQNRERHIFLFIHGQHDKKLYRNPQVAIQSIRTEYKDIIEEIYVIAYGSEITRFQTYDDLRNFAMPPSRFLTNPDLESFDTSYDALNVEEDYGKCGQAGDLGEIRNQARRIGRILGGSKAVAKSWPWQLIIAARKSLVIDTFVNILGGGTVINNRWVLTAAHMFNFIEKSENWEEDIFVGYGMYQRPRRRRSRLPSSVKVFAAAEIILHNRFDFETFDYDIALIRIGRQYIQELDRWRATSHVGFVNYTAYIRPVCLPCIEGNCVGELLTKQGILRGDETEEQRCRIEGNWLLQADEEEKRMLTVVTGFGATTNISAYFENRPNLAANRLQQGVINVKSNPECQFTRDVMADYGLPKGINFTDQMICALGGSRAQVVDACRGDSGGPFVRQVKDSESGDTCWVQIGIVSWGWGCGQLYEINGKQSFFPGFYTNIVAIMDWVKEVISEGVECEVPNPPEDGRVSTRASHVTLNGRITYTCNQGYRLVNNPNTQLTATCQKDSTWSQDAPTCEPISCPERNPPPFATVSRRKDKFRIGEIVRYICHRSRILRGVARSRCQPNGHWSTPLPSCISDRLCPDRRIPEFSYIIPKQLTWSVGDAVRYNCNEGYRLNGTVISECMERGIWSSPTPFCEEITCVIPNPPQNGQVAPSAGEKLPAGATITYDCDDGFRLPDKTSRRVIASCQKDETWSKEVPTCRAITCPNRILKRSIVANETKDVWNAGEVVSYSCRDESLIVNGVATSTCLISGRWSSSVPSCAENRKCPLIEAPLNGKLQKISIGEFGLIRSVGRFSCDRGYVLQGDANLLCLPDFTWSSAVPTCQQQGCFISASSIPDGVSFSDLTREEYRPGQILDVYCSEVGEVLSGDPTMTCRGGNVWEPDYKLYQCAPPNVKCSHPVTPQSVIVIGNTRRRYKTGSVLNFGCENERDILIGTERIECRSDGTWNRDPPSDCRPHPCDRTPCQNGGTCQRDGLGYFCECVAPYEGNDCGEKRKRKCSKPLIPLNGRRQRLGDIGFRLPQSMASYSCRDGYQLVGESILICQNNLQWSSSFPRCVVDSKCRITADQIPPGVVIQNLVNRTFEIGESLRVGCNSSEDVLIGTSTELTCLGRNTWSTSISLFRCRRKPKCTLPILSRLIQVNGAERRKYNVGSIVSFSCVNPQHELEGNERIVCERFEQWSSRPPTTCRAKPCSSSPCENGGTCVRQERSYICLCPADIAGRNCEQRKPCTIPDNIPEEIIVVGVRKEQYTTDEAVTFACLNDNELVVGNTVLTCESDGTWNRNPPSGCELLQRCPLLQPPNNGNILRLGRVELYRPSSFARFVCNNGYKLEGQPIIFCQRNYKWSHTAPICRDEGCKIFQPQIPRGVVIDGITGLPYPPGTQLEVTCRRRNRRLSASSTLTCRGRNIWQPDFKQYTCS